MKTKGEKIALAVAILIVLFYIAVVVTTLIFGVKFFKDHVHFIKDSITADKFISTMKEEGFDVTDIKEAIKAQNYDVKDAYSAKNGRLTIEFYDFNEYEDAEEFYIKSKSGIISNTASKQVSLSGKNYETYTVVRMGRYNLVERIENTVIIIKGSSSHENEAKSIIENLGY